ncbi:Zinc finger protein CONSTANS-LIKE 16 [Sesamum alatum]|uniref:Zinc finger protein CONSTANS-LIKE 16 n=1 Tax=Sesamum alatum TaxID=300844 RepID=A0AAE1Y4T2_9LAMI|nr:Zinc finger protein CONSTANS-LIKE 16 [Sesamum alatum]
MQELKPMVSDRKLANAVGGKSARACDNCVRKRARWYCAADDAFLCQSCDASVHSANPLARRHERVRLKTASISSFDDGSKAGIQISVPSWHQGFTRKARTPRQKKPGKLTDNSEEGNNRIGHPLHLVPEICSEEQSHEENEEQLLYRVPIFDPFVAELCTSANSAEVFTNTFQTNDEENKQGFGHESKAAAAANDFSQEMNHLHGFLPSDMDLAEFAADVESLLGKGLEDESFHMEELGLFDCDEKGKELQECAFLPSGRVKVEDEELMATVHENNHLDVEFDVGRETFELKFDYGSPVACEEEDIKAQNEETIGSTSKTFLRLDYEGVLSAWDDQKSPWTTGERPNLDSCDCWPDHCLGTSGAMHVYGEMGTMSGQAAAMGDGGREARVSRYREKRRTRLFSKKIRYEVRKLNAEKRPRMKGRFVKRSNFAPPAPASASAAAFSFKAQ